MILFPLLSLLRSLLLYYYYALADENLTRSHLPRVANCCSYPLQWWAAEEERKQCLPVFAQGGLLLLLPLTMVGSRGRKENNICVFPVFAQDGLLLLLQWRVTCLLLDSERLSNVFKPRDLLLVGLFCGALFLLVGLISRALLRRLRHIAGAMCIVQGLTACSSGCPVRPAVVKLRASHSWEITAHNGTHCFRASCLSAFSSSSLHLILTLTLY